MGRIQACEANLPIDERWEELDELCDSLEDLQEVRIHLRKEPSWFVDSEVNLRRNLRRAAASIPRIQARMCSSYSATEPEVSRQNHISVDRELTDWSNRVSRWSRNHNW